MSSFHRFSSVELLQKSTEWRTSFRLGRLIYKINTVWQNFVYISNLECRFGKFWIMISALRHEIVRGSIRVFFEPFCFFLHTFFYFQNCSGFILKWNIWKLYFYFLIEISYMFPPLRKIWHVEFHITVPLPGRSGCCCWRTFHIVQSVPVNAPWALPPTARPWS